MNHIVLTNVENKRKYLTLSVMDEAKIVNAVEPGIKKDVASEFGFSVNTLSTAYFKSMFFCVS